MPIAQRLFERAATPEAIAQLSREELEALIAGTTYPEQKAENILALAQRVVSEYDGELPENDGVLQSFKGVGPKCAHLSLGVACDKPHVSVDAHVHRVTNRWGYVSAKTPVKTERALREVLPREYWIEINALLVPPGQLAPVRSLSTAADVRSRQCRYLRLAEKVYRRLTAGAVSGVRLEKCKEKGRDC